MAKCIKCKETTDTYLCTAGGYDDDDNYMCWECIEWNQDVNEPDPDEKRDSER